MIAQPFALGLVALIMCRIKLVRSSTVVQLDSRAPRYPPSSSPLFPVAYNSGWTTSTAKIPGIQNVPLDDASLGVTRVSSGTTHNVVTVAKKQAWEAFYPKGSINPSSSIRGGFGFYLDGPSSWGQQAARELLFSYAVLFEQGWEWQLGGKLPGLYGGVGDYATGCSGGRQDNRDKCFDLRFMWRQQGQGELYAYLPPGHPQTTRTLLAVKPYSFQNSDYGFSVGRGSWTFQPRQWTYIAERVRLNTPGREDGQIQVFVNGKEVIKAYNIAIRETLDSTFVGVHFQTFFGGSSEAWASPKDQRAYFADVSGAVIS